MLAVHTAVGKVVLVQAQGAAQRALAGIRSGAQVTLQGSWRGITSGGAAAAAAAAEGGARGGLLFAATSVVVSGSSAKAPASHTAAGAAAAGAPANNWSALPLVATNVSTLFIPIAAEVPGGGSCPGSGPIKYTAAQVRAAVFGAQGSGPETSVSGLFGSCSYGKTRLTPETSRVVDPVTLPCSGASAGVNWTFATCEFDDFNGWADTADEQLAAAGVVLSQYAHRVYLMPPSLCPWVGLGYVGCDGSFPCRAWIAADFWTSPQAIAHELGHNLYLGHAHAGSDEYGDSTCLMGSCCNARCPNTPHAWQLGWVSLQQLDGSSLAPGQTVSASVASQATSDHAGLRIMPGWAAGAAPVFVGYRTAAGGDADLAPVHVGRVHVYQAGITDGEDTTHPTNHTAPLGAGGSWELATADLVVRVLATTSAAAKVTVCRRGGAETAGTCAAGVDNDCNGLAGADDPVCQPLLADTTSPAVAPRLRVPRPPRPGARRAAAQATRRRLAQLA